MRNFVFICAFVALFCSFTSCCKQCRYEFATAVEEQIQSIDAQIEILEKKMGELKDDAKVKISESISQLRSLRDTALAKLKELKTSSDDAWEDIKPGLKDAVNRLDKAFKKAASNF